MIKWSTQALSIPITCLHIIDDFLLVGEGGSLGCYPLVGGPELSRLQVFIGARVHGVTHGVYRAQRPVPDVGDGHTEVPAQQGPGSTGSRRPPDRHQLIVYGGKQLCRVSLDTQGRLQLVRPSLLLDGWLLDIAPLPGGPLAALDSHGRLLRLTADLSRQVAPPVRCPDRCILYSGALLPGASPGDALLAFCGTVFCQVLIWAPGDAGRDGQILHRLTGHTGVIFRLTLEPSLDTLLSCSDDRSVRRWRRSGDDWRHTAPAPAGALFGHEARVWSALPAGRRTVSVGEDSRVCLWSPDGRLERRWRAHAGASVRAAAADEAGRRLATGGGDGAVLVWPVSEPAAAPGLLPAPAGDRVRSLVSLDGCRQLLVTDTGRLLLMRRRHGRVSGHRDGGGGDSSGHRDGVSSGDSGRDSSGDRGCGGGVSSGDRGGDSSGDSGRGGGSRGDGVTTGEVLSDRRLASYALLAVRADGRRVALAGRRGHIIMLSTDGGGLAKVADQQVLDGKIYSLHWLDTERLLICDGAGQLYVLSDVSGGLCVTRRHQLPPSRQCWVSAAALRPPETLVVGDRDGSLHVLQPDQLEPSQTLRRLVGRYGATSITMTEGATDTSSSGTDVATGGALLVTARDGTARRLRLGPDGALHQTSCLRLPWDWVAGVTRLAGQDTVIGFHASQLVLWSVPAGREVWRADCGGGHRSWALSVSGRRLWLSWVSEGSVRHVTCPLGQLRTTVIKPGVQGGGTLSAALLGPAPDGGTLVALAGQDGTVRLVSAGCTLAAPLTPPSTALRPLSILRGHISAVRAVCRAGSAHLVSAGGRGQLLLWQLTDGGAAALQLSSHRVRPESRQRADDTPETRYMDLAARWPDGEGRTVMVAAAGSDGVVRVFGFSPESPSPCLSLLARVPLADRCLLRLRWLHTGRLAVSGTDGSVWLCPVPPDRDGTQLGGTGPKLGKETGQKSRKEAELRQDSGQECDESPERGQQTWHEQESKESVQESSETEKPVRLPALHQSGVNALEVLADRSSGAPPDRPAGFSLLTGGDDGALCLSRLSADGRLTPGPKLAPAHASQVTGVSWLPSGRLLSVSVDQRLCVWQQLPDSDLLRMVSCHLTDVADLKGLLHWTDQHGRTVVLVYGEGVELLRLELPTLTAATGNS